jgi:N-acyl-phosphatidylethanolamine-hydrolysing phospholipase D
MSSIFSPKTAAQKVIVEKIAARVRERNSWSTWHNHSPGEVFKFLSKYKLSMPNLPSQKELDAEFPVQAINWELLSSNQKKCTCVTWLGHATCLVQMGGFSILTDPLFSDRCAPTQFAGPKRYRPNPCSVEEVLQNIQSPLVVVVSHNHYDHLDYNSIKDLSEKSENPIIFVVPLGLADWLRTNFPKMEDRHQIAELDWHETYSVSSDDKNKLEVTAVPMQHWSSRRGYDRDKTLWCGFSLCCTSDDHKDQTKTTRALFAGDTGWFEGLYDIGAKYGPYDVAMIPIGAYEPYDFMQPQHNNPKDAVKMMQAINARRAVPIHWGTFQLTKEYYMEPPKRLKRCMEIAGLDQNHFASWLIGETIAVDK